MDLSGTQPPPPAGVAPSNLLEHVEQWLARRWVPAVINLAALALLSFTLAQGTWRLLTPTTAANGPKANLVADTGDYNLQALVSANLFGQAAPTAKADVALESVPISNLNLVLTGVMVTPGGSFALISSDGSPELPFGVEQEITNGVTLYAVYSDRVLIRRGGATESLMLKDNGQNLADGSIISPRTPSRRVARNSNTGIVQQGGNNFRVDRQQLTQQMQNPEFLTQALMVPNAGGGFLVREIQPGSVYETLGLRVGDVINSVNGQQVNSVEDVMRLYAQLGTASNVQIDVRRAGRSESLVYNIQ
jgi:general secretion pathway protein C